MISYAEAIAQCAEHIARDDTHGYSQPNRKGYGTEELTFSDGTKYYIHHGDYDCSEMARQCVESAGLLSHDSHMWTGNEHDVLTSVGFSVVPLSDRTRGDILWKPGHTGIYLGRNYMADAHGDEWGGITGPTQGDQTGSEIEIRPYGSCSWTRCYRPPQGIVAASRGISDSIGINGVDLSNWDAGTVPSKIGADFVIVKASEGTHFKDACAKRFLDDASSHGIKYGMYHFAVPGDPESQAAYFYDTMQETGYLEGATIWIDFEGDVIENGGVNFAKRFIDRIEAFTGKICGIYMSQSVTCELDWSVLKDKPLWVAQYANDNPTGYQDTPWSVWDFGAWGNKCDILQYTSMGYHDGCGPFDLDKGYFTDEQWAAWATGTTIEPSDDTDQNGDYFKMDSKLVIFRDTVNIRTEPSTHADIVGQYHEGERVVIDGVAVAGGYSWGHYIGATSGKDRYVALGSTDYIE